MGEGERARGASGAPSPRRRGETGSGRPQSGSSPGRAQSALREDSGHGDQLAAPVQKALKIPAGRGVGHSRWNLQHAEALSERVDIEARLRAEATFRTTDRVPDGTAHRALTGEGSGE